MKTQRCNVLVFLGGDLNNSVYKAGVTPPEIAVLRQVHGASSVRDIEIEESVTLSSDQERERLSLIYGLEVVSNLFGQFGELPSTLTEARIEDDLVIADFSTKKKKKVVVENAEEK